MKAKAVRMHGENDLRLEEFELNPLGADEILADIVTDSICMSTYKAAIQGSKHKRVPADIAENPIVVGHEFAGVIREVGARWKGKYKSGDPFTIQPNINYLNKGYAPGYSFSQFGGDATSIVIPGVVMEKDCLLQYKGDAFFKASLAEPISCLIAAFHASYHIAKDGKTHAMGIRPNGCMAILAGCGPMGLGAVDLALHMDVRPSKLVVTDIDEKRLARAKKILSPETAKACGVMLTYVNTAEMADPAKELLAYSDGNGFDDVFVLAPVAAVVETGVAIAAQDACINFFSGPTNPAFSAMVNFYDIHYKGCHYMGTSGGDADDLREAVAMIETGRINPAVMVSHIGGLNAAAEATCNLPKIPGGKKLIYTNLDMPLMAIDDFAAMGEKDEMYRALYEICSRHEMLWSTEAEKYLLANAKRI